LSPVLDADDAALATDSPELDPADDAVADEDPLLAGLFDEAVAEHAIPAHYPVEPEVELGGEESVQTLPPTRLRSVLESLLFVADKPLPLQRLLEILEEQAREPSGRAEPPLYQASQVQQVLVELAADFIAQGRGVELHQVAGGWQFRTAPQNAAWVQRQLQQKPQRLSRAQLETMTIIAYRQPITRPEIDDVRGVDSGGALKTLLERRLVRILGKKEEPGRPLLYGTTREFLEFFNLRDLKDLPTLREYYELNDENKARVRAAHPDGLLEGFVSAAQPSGTPPGGTPPGGAATSPEDGQQQIALPQTAPVAPPPPTAAATEGATATPPLAASLSPAAPLSRVEILDQQLADDAEQLSKIDELIASVRVDTPPIDVLLGMAEAAAQAETAVAATSPDGEADEEEADDESVAQKAAGPGQPGSTKE
jgi:segregation and condensation protein B